MTRWLIAIVLAVPLWAAAATDDSRARFREIWQTEWAWRLQEMPLLATSVGVHDYDDQLGAVAPPAQARRLRYWRKVLSQLDAIDAAQLGGSERVDYLIYRAQIESLAAGGAFDCVEPNRAGVHGAAELRHRLNSEDDPARVLAMLDAFYAPLLERLAA